MKIRYWQRYFPILAAAAILAASIACEKASPEEIRKYTLTPSPSSSPLPSETSTPAPADTPTPGPSDTPSPTPIVSKISALQSVNVRREPGEDKESLGILYSGAEVELTGECSGDGWAEIRFGPGRAWILAKYLSGNYCKEEE